METALMLVLECGYRAHILLGSGDSRSNESDDDSVGFDKHGSMFHYVAFLSYNSPMLVATN